MSEYGSDFESTSHHSPPRSLSSSRSSSRSSSPYESAAPAAPPQKQDPKPKPQPPLDDNKGSTAVPTRSPRPMPLQPASLRPHDKPKQQMKKALPPEDLSSLTQQEKDDLYALRKKNAELRNSLIDLNNQLDQHLNRHGQKVARPFSPRQRQLTSADRQHRRNDATRRLNAEIIQKLQRADALDRVQEVRNLLNEKNHILQKAREENRSLENVYANQMVKVEDVERTEDDMRMRKAEHQEEMRMIKEKMRRLKIQNSERSGQVKSNQRQLQKLEGKVKVQESVGAAMKTLQELRDEESEKDRVIETLKYQVAVLSKTNASDKRHARNKSAQTSKELAELREEAALLRERAASHRLVDELADPYEL